MKLTQSLCVFTCIANLAMAEPIPKYKQLLSMDLGEMLKVEVATGTAKELSEAPAVVSVITAADIHATGARTLAEAVERVPGLHVMRSEFRLGNMFAIRGIQTTTTPQILVLMDGVSLSELAQWATPISFKYPTNFIDRIEIIRGPGSAVYGANAYSGVINIITKQATSGINYSVGGRLGSFDTKEAWLNANFELGQLKVALSYTRQEQGNDDDQVTPFGVLERQNELNNLHLNLTYGNFTMKNWYWDTEQFMGVGASLWGNDVDVDISDSYKTQLDWSANLSDRLEASAKVSYYNSASNAYFQLLPANRAIDPALPDGTWVIGDDGNLFTGNTPVNFPNGVIGNPSGDTKRIHASAAVIYSPNDSHRIRVEVGGEQEKLTNVREIKNFGPGVLDVDSLPEYFVPGTFQATQLVDVTGTDYIYSPKYDRDLWYISLQDEWKIVQGWELTAGIRHDNYSDFGSTTNPRVALVWNTTDKLTSKLLYGSAYRAPMVAELAYINNPATLGNPNLNPETIETIELAFDYRLDKQCTAMLNLFSYQAEDLIATDETGVNNNIGQQDGLGVELEVNWQLTQALQINVNFSYLNAELPLTNEDKALVPGKMSYLDLRYQVNNEWQLSTQTYLITDRKRQMGDTRDQVDNYTQVDFSASWQPEEVWALKFGVKNLLDEEIYEPSPNSGLFALGLGFPGDYPMNSRNIFGEVSFSF